MIRVSQPGAVERARSAGTPERRQSRRRIAKEKYSRVRDVIYKQNREKRLLTLKSILKVLRGRSEGGSVVGSGPREDSGDGAAMDEGGQTTLAGGGRGEIALAGLWAPRFGWRGGARRVVRRCWWGRRRPGGLLICLNADDSFPCPAGLGFRVFKGAQPLRCCTRDAVRHPPARGLHRHAATSPVDGEGHLLYG